jgi:hypothetical protein
VRVGPLLTLIFENRQTLWFRLQEVLRVARMSEPGLLQQELDLYNRLLPGRNQLQATLLIAASSAATLSAQLGAWRSLRGEQITFRIGDIATPADLITCRPEDRCIGAAHWVQFTLDAVGRGQLADYSCPAFFAADAPDYRHDGPALSDEVRQSLLDDLELSDRD